jgi:isocitrate dehydrogenase
MVNSDKGITNLHVPSDVIVDASMPVKWSVIQEQQDTIALIPDRFIPEFTAATIEFCKKHGALTQEQWEVFQMYGAKSGRVWLSW